MTILAFGGEMGFFVPSDADTNEQAPSGKYNTAFARGCTASLGTASYMETPDVSTQADLWFHVDVHQNSIATESSTQTRIIEFLDSGGIAQLRLTANWTSGGSHGIWQLEHNNGSSWDSLGNCDVSGNSLQTLDFHIVSNTVSGTVDLYFSGTQRIAGTVNLSGLTGINKVRMYGVTRPTRTYGYYSQVVLATESTITKRVGTIVMTGQGTTHTFATGGFAAVDELAYSDADIWNGDTNGQIELCTGTPVPSFTSYVVRAVGVTVRAKKESTGPAHMRLLLRSAGTTYDSGSDIALGFGYAAYSHVWETNPATSAAFLSSAIAALEYGVKAIT